MKRFFGLLNVLICLELIVSPLGPHLNVISFQDAEAVVVPTESDPTPNTPPRRETPPKKSIPTPSDAEPVHVPLPVSTSTGPTGGCSSGMTFDPNLGRCIVNDAAASTMNKAALCDGKSGEERVKCFKQNAVDERNKATDNGTMGGQANLGGLMGGLNKAVTAAAIAVPLTIAFRGMNNIKSTCSSISLYSLLAGAAALYVGDNLANILHGRRLDKIESDWANIIKGNPDETDKDQQRLDSTETQKEAFEMLAKQEDSLADAAKMKSYFYGAATIAFAVSMGFAIYEYSNPVAAAGSICAVEGSGQPKASAAGKAAAGAAAAPADSSATAPDSPPAAGPAPAPEPPAPTPVPEPAPAPAPTPAPDATTSASLYFPPNSSSMDWESEVMRQKHAMNLKTATNLASFYVLSKAVQYRNSSPSLQEYESVKKFMAHAEEDSKEVLDYLKMISVAVMTHISPLPAAQAEAGKYAITAVSQLGGATVLTSAASMFSDKIGQWLSTPGHRAIVSGVLAGWSGVMTGWSIHQNGRSRERAGQLRKLKEEFSDASGAINACKPEDRKDPQKPQCYCYTPENQRNPGRANSKICSAYWDGGLKGAGEYYGTGDVSIPGCISSGRQYDSQCACRKSSKGCMKSTPSNFGSLNLGSFKMLASGLAPLDQLSSGTFNAAGVDAASLSNQAMRVMRANDNLLKDPRLKPLKVDIEKNGPKLAKQIQGMGQGISPDLGDRGSMPATPSQAVAALEKELKEHGVEREKISASTLAAPQSAARPEFGMTEEELTAQQGQLAEAMAQELDYGKNDISAGKNIFEVLSNRYQRSGLRRLFDEDGKTKPDRPAETDVSK